MWVLLHVLGAGVWLGCVLTEVAFERALSGQGPDMDKRLAHLHWRVDVWIEGPALVLVGLTGGVLWSAARGDAALLVMATAGGTAIVANLRCMHLVWQRDRAAQAGDPERFADLDWLQHRWGAGVLLGLLVAAGAGVAHRLG